MIQPILVPLCFYNQTYLFMVWQPGIFSETIGLSYLLQVNNDATRQMITVLLVTIIEKEKQLMLHVSSYTLK